MLSATSDQRADRTQKSWPSSSKASSAPTGLRAAVGQAVGGRLVYVGRVGTGIANEALRALRKELEPMRQVRTPVDVSLMERRDQRLALWVEPIKIVGVFHQGIGSQGLLRQAAFKAFRADKTLADLETESAEAGKTVRRGVRAPRMAARPVSRCDPRTLPALSVSRRQRTDPADPAADAVRITHDERILNPVFNRNSEGES